MLPNDAVILDIGAGGRRICPEVITVDAFDGPGVDVIGDIHCLPFEDGHADCIVCTGTLEHVANPFVAIAEIYRVLKPGGIVHIDVPFIQGYHADPTDYWRFTKDGLVLLCKQFREISSGVHIGPSCGVVWIVREWADSITDNRFISNGLLALTAIVMAPFRYLDYLLIHSKRSHRVASAVYFVGRKD
jgi:SAM-dependent methyltransferase